MDSMRGLNTSLPGTSPSKQAAPSDSPEQLLDAFRAAALSVTKLYKTSAAAQSKARQEGYQDCLDDLLAFLDKGSIGLDDGEGWKIRRWATERLDGRDSVSQTVESDDEADKADTASSPEITRANSATQLSALRAEGNTRTGSAPPSISPVIEEPVQISVPSQDTFTFQAAHPYPQDAYLNLANLDLSDSRSHDSISAHGVGGLPTPTARSSRVRYGGTGPRSGSRQGSHLGRGAGQKRKINFAEIFDLGSLGHDKNMFGSGGGKRSRHT